MLYGIARFALATKGTKSTKRLVKLKRQIPINRFVLFVPFVATSSFCGASYPRPGAFRIQSKNSVIN